MFATFVPFCFSVIFISLTLTKAVHLYIHAKTVPPAAFALYLPSLLLPDVLVICLARWVMQRRLGIAAMTACVLAIIFSFIVLGGAASQLGFFYETGAEVEWSDAMEYVGDSDGMKILLSGLGSVFAAGTFIIVTAWFAKLYLHRAVGAFSFWVTSPIIDGMFVPAYAFIRSKVKGDRHKSRNEFNNDDDEDDDESDEEKGLVYGQRRKRSLFQPISLIILAALVAVGLTTIYRPHTPYSLMSATLPVVMLEMFKATPDMCNGQTGRDGNGWPLPDLTDKSKWELPTSSSKGWAPGGNNQYAKQYRDHTPEWLPENPGPGFAKWIPKNDTAEDAEIHDSCLGTQADGTFYNPVSDPIKISNLDRDIIDVLQEAFSNETVKIKHVALIMMESYREELFPLQQGSDYHKMIMESHKEGDEDKINARLAHMSPVAERITGKPNNFKKRDGSDFDPAPMPSWNDTTKDGYGGINVVGGLTTSSLSFKSMAAIHCGAWPMPVDSFEESETQAYQPCIPQVFDLLNNLKGDESTDDFLEQQWSPAFFQSITDGYDRQKKFDRNIGFQHIVTKSRLDHDANKAGTELEEINYFGYAETTLKKNIDEYIKQVQQDGKRMFFSHFTSTTHHPWGVPKSFESTDYLETNGKMRWHKDFNKYLNAIRFTDAWLGELLQTFENFGISNETLVVFVGDHGQAFKEDVSKTGTYENSHISNFRVPITFRHPQMPRVQYKANATSLSILPTILDLLMNTGSLNKKDSEAVSDIIQDYEGQSLIRPYRASHNGRRAWNFGVINGGGRMLAMTSADAPWRLVIPLDEKSEFRFTDLKNDPLELDPHEDWTMQALADAVKRKYGDEAGQWAVEAEAIGRWWGLERKRLWGYSPQGSSS